MILSQIPISQHRTIPIRSSGENECRLVTKEVKFNLYYKLTNHQRSAKARKIKKIRNLKTYHDLFKTIFKKKQKRRAIMNEILDRDNTSWIDPFFPIKNVIDKLKGKK